MKKEKKKDQNEETTKEISLWKLSWNQLQKHKVALAGGIFVILFILIAITAPVISPYDPLKTDFQSALKAPSFLHLFLFLFSRHSLGEDAWEELADLPTARSYFAGAAL